MPYTGVCKWFNQIKGQGVIVHEDLNNLELHNQEILCDNQGYEGNAPKHEDRLFYELEFDEEKKKYRAVNITGGSAEAFDISKKKTKKANGKKKAVKRETHNRWAPQNNGDWNSWNSEWNSSPASPSQGWNAPAPSQARSPQGWNAPAPSQAPAQTRVVTDWWGNPQTVEWKQLPTNNTVFNSTPGQPVYYNYN